MTIQALVLFLQKSTMQLFLRYEWAEGVVRVELFETSDWDFAFAEIVGTLEIKHQIGN